MPSTSLVHYESPIRVFFDPKPILQTNAQMQLSKWLLLLCTLLKILIGFSIILTSPYSIEVTMS